MDNSKDMINEKEENIEKQNFVKIDSDKTGSSLEDYYLSDDKRAELESIAQEYLDEQNSLNEPSKKQATIESVNNQVEFETEIQEYFDSQKKLREKVTKDPSGDSVNKKTEFAAEVQGYLDEQKQLEEQNRQDAINNARKRYAEKSLLYKFFHKKLSDKKAEEMTTSEINKLYDGVEPEKGILR